jgi:predicted ATP-dependent Lon-type protease
MATELLSKSLDKLGEVPVEVVVYFDDILIAGDSPEVVEQVTHKLRSILMADGWRISAKSVTTADTHIRWMGKDLDGQSWTVTSSAEYTADMVDLPGDVRL